MHNIRPLLGTFIPDECQFFSRKTLFRVDG